MGQDAAADTAPKVIDTVYFSWMKSEAFYAFWLISSICVGVLNVGLFYGALELIKYLLTLGYVNQLDVWFNGAEPDPGIREKELTEEE